MAPREINGWEAGGTSPGVDPVDSLVEYVDDSVTGQLLTPPDDVLSEVRAVPYRAASTAPREVGGSVAPDTPETGVADPDELAGVVQVVPAEQKPVTVHAAPEVLAGEVDADALTNAVQAEAGCRREVVAAAYEQHEESAHGDDGASATDPVTEATLVARHGNGDNAEAGNEAGADSDTNESTEGHAGGQSDGGGDVPPETPPVGELGPIEPSPLARAIGARSVHELQRAQLYAPTYLGDDFEGSPEVADETGYHERAFTSFAERRLREPEATVPPATVVRDTLTEADVDWLLTQGMDEDGRPLTVEQIAASMPTREDYDALRRRVHIVAAASVIADVDTWNGGAESPEDSLFFLRIQDAAAEIATEYGLYMGDPGSSELDIPRVFEVPAPGEENLFALAVQRAYPGGAAEYVAERMEQGRQSEREARAGVYKNAIIDQIATASPTLAFDLSSRDRLRSPRPEFAQRTTLGVDEYEAMVEAELARMHAWTLIFTTARLEEVWGDTALFDLPIEQQAWLSGYDVGTADVMTDTDRDHVGEIIALGRELLTAPDQGEVIVSADDLERIAGYVASFAVRVTELNPTELLSLAALFDHTLPVRFIGDRPAYAMAEDMLGNTGVTANLVRLAADITNYGPLNNPPLPLPDVQDRESVEVGTQRLDDLRLAIVMRQFRMLYPSLFAERVERTGVRYYGSEHFLTMETLLRDAIADYLGQQSGETGEREPWVGPLGSTGGIGIVPRIGATIRTVNYHDMPVNYNVAAAASVIDQLDELASNSYLLIDYGDGEFASLEGQVGAFVGTSHQVFEPTGGPNIRSGELRLGRGSEFVTIRSFYDPLDDPGFAMEQVANEYAAALTLNRLSTSTAQLQSHDILGFCRYFELDPATGDQRERVGIVLEENASIVPYAAILFGGGTLPTQEAAMGTMQAVGESLGMLHADGFMLGGVVTADTIAIDRETGQRYCLNTQGLRARPSRTSTDSWYALEDPLEDLGSVLADVSLWDVEAPDLDINALRQALFDAYRTAAAPRMQALGDEFWDTLRTRLGV